MKAITPLESCPELASAIGVKEFFFKREDLHPLGSHKGRSIPAMIDGYAAAGSRRFAVSSSGNAALAAALHIRELNAGGNRDNPIDLDVFVGRRAAARKIGRLMKLADNRLRVTVTERPLQALARSVNGGSTSLRQSVNDAALTGYRTLAEEIAGGLKPGQKAAVFVAASSGTTAQALAQYFLDNKLPVQVHIVQTSSCHPIADAFNGYDGPDEQSFADAIVDKSANRKDALVPLIRETGGRGWTIANGEITAARKLILKGAGFKASANGALSVAGAVKAAKAGHDVTGTVICVIGGE